MSVKKALAITVGCLSSSSSSSLSTDWKCHIREIKSQTYSVQPKNSSWRSRLARRTWRSLRETEHHHIISSHRSDRQTDRQTAHSFKVKWKLKQKGPAHTETQNTRLKHAVTACCHRFVYISGACKPRLVLSKGVWMDLSQMVKTEYLSGLWQQENHRSLPPFPFPLTGRPTESPLSPFLPGKPGRPCRRRNNETHQWRCWRPPGLSSSGMSWAVWIDEEFLFWVSDFWERH